MLNRVSHRVRLKNADSLQLHKCLKQVVDEIKLHCLIQENFQISPCKPRMKKTFSIIFTYNFISSEKIIWCQNPDYMKEIRQKIPVEDTINGSKMLSVSTNSIIFRCHWSIWMLQYALVGRTFLSKKV